MSSKQPQQRRLPPTTATTGSTSTHYPPTNYSLDESQILQIAASLAQHQDNSPMPHRNLDDVPEEEGPGSAEGSIRGLGGGSSEGGGHHYTASRTLYLNNSAANSSTTLMRGGDSASGSASSTPLIVPGHLPSVSGSTPSSKQPRKTSSVRTLGRTSNEHLQAPGPSSNGNSVRRSPSSTSTLKGGHSGHRIPSSSSGIREPKTRSAPRMHHDKEAEPAPATGMYWSRAAVWGTLPSRTLRSPSITLIDNLAWVLGGSDDRDAVGTRDVLTFDTDTMQWARPETIGDSPPPCRAHTATLIDKKIVLYGGGIGGLYYGHLYIFDTVARKWIQPPVHDGPKPIPRRAHTAVYYKGKVWIFGGGNGLMALSDLWTLDLGPNFNGVLDSATGKRAARWTEIEVHGTRPGPRGYHSATLVKDTMVVVGGSDSKECYTDIWCLNLDTLVWKKAVPQTPIYKRLSHSASQVGSYLFIVGGHNGSDYCSEILFLNLVSLLYEARTVYGKGPSSRGNHATILADSRIFLFGGYNGVQGFDDVFILDLAASAYLPQVTSFEIEALPEY